MIDHSILVAEMSQRALEEPAGLQTCVEEWDYSECCNAPVVMIEEEQRVCCACLKPV